MSWDELWYVDDDGGWDNSYDDSFSLAGTSDGDSGWFDSLLDVGGSIVGGAIDIGSKLLSSDAGLGVVGGAAQGILGYMGNKDVASATALAVDDKKKTRDAHNASINNPYTGAKNVRYR